MDRSWKLPLKIIIDFFLTAIGEFCDDLRVQISRILTSLKNQKKLD